MNGHDPPGSADASPVEIAPGRQLPSNSFAISQCKMLGPKAAGALDALKELKVRKAASADIVAKIDAAIAAIEGGGAEATQ